MVFNSLKPFPHYRQQDQMDCGATCLRIICKYYGRNIGIQELRNLCQTTRDGVNLLGISEAAEKIGFRTQGLKLKLDQLKETPLPCILHWKQNHFVVLYKVKKGNYYVSDPASVKSTFSEEDFTNNWYAHRELHSGISLIISPTPRFYEDKDDIKSEKLDWSKILNYFFSYRKLFIQLFLGFLIGTILQLTTPFLTQAMVDTGINTNNLNFVKVVLIAQLALFIGQIGVDFIRAWILLHISTRVNIFILTDLLIKMMRLPMKFFESKTTGDIMQRMTDQRRIETFLTGSALNTMFSLVNLIVFGFVLAFYHVNIFLIFVASTLLYTLWILLFLKRRKELDHKRFAVASDDQTQIVELVTAMQEIKLNNAEKQRRWLWEAIQARLFKFKVKNLTLSQNQQAGAMAINQLKNILITFMSANAVITGELTLGGMIAIQYILGIVSSPIEQLLGFIQAYQDAKISLERINEIYSEEEEEPMEQEWITSLPINGDIQLKDVTFCYPGAGNKPVLTDVSLVFPDGKTTAIVGMSGSGKTTVLKLILRFFDHQKGDIFIGQNKLDQISYSTWREACGVVMQEGFIFADTIENNISMGDESPNREKIDEAIRIANLDDFVNEQPFKLKTKIGVTGKGISQGQRQRLLIARAVYKDPRYILFDEATNALDAQNERTIIDNLKSFAKGRTSVIIAHRLSTVSHADKIVVLNKGRVAEQGTHEVLIRKKGYYYELVKNQLELEK